MSVLSIHTCTHYTLPVHTTRNIICTYTQTHITLSLIEINTFSVLSPPLCPMSHTFPSSFLTPPPHPPPTLLCHNLLCHQPAMPQPAMPQPAMSPTCYATICYVPNLLCHNLLCHQPAMPQSAMSLTCYATTCYATACYATICYVTTCYATTCYAMTCYVTILPCHQPDMLQWWHSGLMA